MSLELTPAGQQANEIMNWAYQSPRDRVQIAIQQVDEIARQLLSEQERIEVTDVGTQLSRLAGSLSPAGRTLPPGTISSQVSG